jgi:uncharacterized membrane protein
MAAIAVAIAVASAAAVATAVPTAARESPGRHRHPDHARPCVVPGAGEPLDEIWRANMRAALRYARHRAGDIAFAVRTPGASTATGPTTWSGRPAWSRRC